MIKIDNSTQVKIEKIYDRLVEDIGDKFILYSHLNTGEITFVSKGFEAIFGIAKKDIIGKTWHKEINWLPECLDLTKEMVTRVVECRESFVQVEMQFIHPDGKIKTIRVSFHPVLDENDCVISIDGIVEDITDFKSAQRLKDEFISTVSHELRTPLSAINGAIKLINSGMLGAQQEQQKEMLNMIESNTERLLFLVNQLLDIEKLENSNLDLHKTKFHLKSFIKECIAENQHYAEQFSTNIQLKECNDLEINADKICLKQVLSNLISNACKFSPPGKPVEITATVGNGMLHITVTDHGPGIPKSFHEKIFEKFIQKDSSNTRKYEGSGLGLAIVKKIVEMLDGTIWFDTADNVGTTFSVRIPL